MGTKSSIAEARHVRLPFCNKILTAVRPHLCRTLYLRGAMAQP